MLTRSFARTHSDKLSLEVHAKLRDFGVSINKSIRKNMHLVQFLLNLQGIDEHKVGVASFAPYTECISIEVTELTNISQ